MSNRELIALGTSSQVPTRDRSHNAYLLRWNSEGFLLDPGEGTQRQLTLADLPASAIHHICITHFHGDHCLGLAGILQRLSLDRCNHPVHIYYPESGRIYIERLSCAAIFKSEIELIHHPAAPLPDELLPLCKTKEYTLSCALLEHSVPTIGYRLEESANVRFLPARLEQLGIRGSLVGELQRNGSIDIHNRIVRLEEVTEPRRGSIFAYVMDTRPCLGAITLAKGADLLVMEATYSSEHQELAALYGHSTAADAAMTAMKAGACRLAMGHFSQRYSNSIQHLDDAQKIFPNAIALNDLDRIEIRRPEASE